MGEELVSDFILPEEGRDSETLSSFSYTDTFKSYLPFYLSIGLTYEQFWDDDVDLCMYYRKAFELKKKRMNEQLWLQGLYVYEAILDNAPILRALSKETQPVKYSKEPYPLSNKEIRERKEKEEREKFERIREKLTEMVGRDI